MDWYFVGVDFGQSRDFTAIAVVERAETTGAWDAAMFAWRKVVSLQLRYLERVARGTPYTEVVERVVQVTRWPELAGRCRLAVDGTGVGRPVVDLLRRERPGCVVMPVNITGGLMQTTEGGYYGVPKRDLILGLQVLLQRGVLRIAAGLEYGADLVKEMAAMQVKISLSGHEQYAVWREGTHDDLVFAVALACWNAQNAYPNDPAGGEQWWTNQHQADAARIFRKKKD
ncbi:MAG: hypothetical protein ABSC05_26905 [Candidatus Solibacter sp.]|jgi:hypothetical protein